MKLNKFYNEACKTISKIKYCKQQQTVPIKLLETKNVVVKWFLEMDPLQTFYELCDGSLRNVLLITPFERHPQNTTDPVMKSTLRQMSRQHRFESKTINHTRVGIVFDFHYFKGIFCEVLQMF